jgi:hypothetical protein
MKSAPDMLTPHLPTATPLPQEQHYPALRRDLVRNEDTTPRYYGQLVDIEWKPFHVQLSDAAANTMCADERAHA